MGCRELCSEAWRLCRCSPEGPSCRACSPACCLLRLEWRGLSQGPVTPGTPVAPPPSSLKSPGISVIPLCPAYGPTDRSTGPGLLRVISLLPPPTFPRVTEMHMKQGAHVTTAPFAEALGLPGTFRGLGRSLTLPLEAPGGQGVLLSRGFSEHHPRRSGSISCWTGSEQCAGRTKNRVRAPGGFSKAHRLLVPQLLMSSCHGLGLRGLLPEPAVTLPEQAPWQGARHCPSPSAVGRHGTLHGCSQGRPPGPPRGVLRQGLTVLYRDAMIKTHSIRISGRDFLPVRQRGRELGLGKALSQLHRAEASGQMPRCEADFPGLRVWACHPVTPLMAYCPLPSPSVGSTCSPHRSAPRLVHGVPPEAKWTAGAGCPPDRSWGRARAQPSSHSHLL